jgi:hypothetical protein
MQQSVGSVTRQVLQGLTEGTSVGALNLSYRKITVEFNEEPNSAVVFCQDTF